MTSFPYFSLALDSTEYLKTLFFFSKHELFTSSFLTAFVSNEVLKECGKSPLFQNRHPLVNKDPTSDFSRHGKHVLKLSITIIFLYLFVFDDVT